MYSIYKNRTPVYTGTWYTWNQNLSQTHSDNIAYFLLNTIHEMMTGFERIILVSTCLVYCVTFCIGFALSPQRRVPSWKQAVSENFSCENVDRTAVWNFLLENFQGDFDNYSQVVEDRANNLVPREGGGHENFHCTLVPVTETSRLAAFYFDGNPQRIFRFRYYELSNNDDDDACCVEMRLYTLHPELEGLLRSCAEDPMKWPTLFSDFSSTTSRIDYLKNCEIAWSVKRDPIQHSYVPSSNDNDASVHAVMVHGEAIVDSTIIPGIKIRILDQLSLYEDVFYINDRGLDPETGAFIYGNHRGVPYRLERVTRLNGSQERQVVNDELQWTMGPQWRTQEEYDEKINAIGGPSAQMSRGPKAKQ